MDYNAVPAQVLALTKQEQRVAYRVLKRQFQLDDELLEDLKDDLIYAKKLAVDEDVRVLVWTGASGATALAAAVPAAPWKTRHPILRRKSSPRAVPWKANASRSPCSLPTSKTRQRSSGASIPEAAQQLLDPALQRMMDAVHRFEGTVNQVLGDGIMALFGAPIAHEDHALRACYAALAMQSHPHPSDGDPRIFPGAV